MCKSPRSAAAEKLRERIVVIENLKHQLLELEALREEVTEAERLLAPKTRSSSTIRGELQLRRRYGAAHLGLLAGWSDTRGRR
jgi:hypothetical protein